MMRISIPTRTCLTAVVFLLTALLVSVVPCKAEQAVMSWEAVSDVDLIGYKIYWGPASRQYTDFIDVGNVTSYEIPQPAPGATYYYAITAYGSSKEESLYSDEAVLQITLDGEPLFTIKGDTNDSQTGWWYDPQEDGTGISLEVQNSSLFLAWYVYDEVSGDPIWFSSGGVMKDPLHYSGDLMVWRSDSSAPGSGPYSSSQGTISLTFQTDKQASMQWSLDGLAHEKTIMRFLDKITAGTKDPRVIHGWWYDPNNEGEGVFIEAEGDTLFMAWYTYREDGSPVWLSAGGSFPVGSDRFTGSLTEWRDGTCPGCAYRTPTAWPADRREISLQFLLDDQVIMTWDGGQMNLTRFPFGE